MNLEGKNAIVTGMSKGGGGIGRAIALALAELGANVAVTGGSSPAAAEAVAAEIEALGRKAIALQCDVSNASQVENLISQVLTTWGSLDIVVNNAGVTKDGLVMRMSEEDWDLVLDINLKGAFLMTKAALRPMMKQRSGKIINISSVIGLIANPGQANYSASKAGLIGFTRTVAKEVATRNIQVNAVAPGFIETAMTDALNDEQKAKIVKEIPAGRLGSPEDIAAAVSFLSSSLSSYITGQVLTVDGGLVI
ncbi:MAG: 3-oxoacyl-[acyl-carrier-protein] reductase [Capsulimonas sp.]|uniref:3-oxoacyl-[acyl-carrier-protein] reductase n=1 Tax=Capsulimonas sp. TaxID=2494211 RepID=UPI0032651FD7